MQIKTKMKYHLPSVRMAIIRKSTNNKCWRGCREKGTLVHLSESKLVYPLSKTVWTFPKKLKIKLPHDPAIPLLSTWKTTKMLIWKDTCTPMFITALFYNCHGMEATQVSINRWMDKEYMVYIYNRILLSHKKEWNSANLSNIDGPREYYA